MISEKQKEISIAILDDHKMVANLLKSSFTSLDFTNRIETFSNAKVLFDFLDQNKVDILVSDVFMPEVNGLEIVKQCREKYSKEKLKIIILSSSIEYRIINEAVSNGANAYVTKEDYSDEILNAIDHVLKDSQKVYFSKRATDALLSDRFLDESQIKLSPREEQLLKLICLAKSPKEIAFDLDLSVNTIHYYTKRLMLKMNVNRTADLILKAINKGFVLDTKRDSNANFSS